MNGATPEGTSTVRDRAQVLPPPPTASPGQVARSSQTPVARQALACRIGVTPPRHRCGRLGHPHQRGRRVRVTLKVSSGELAIFSTALDGAGAGSVPLLTAQPGPVPPVHGPPSRGM